MVMVIFGVEVNDNTHNNDHLLHHQKHHNHNKNKKNRYIRNKKEE